MANEQQTPEESVVTYTPEELKTIQDLTQFFDKAPGEVAVDTADGIPPTDTDSGALDGGVLDTDGIAPDVSKRPVADLSKFDDVMNMDIDNFDTPGAAGEIQDIPLSDTPVQDTPLDVPDLGGLDLSPATATGDALDDMSLPDAGSGGLDDMSLPDTGSGGLDDMSLPDAGSGGLDDMSLPDAGSGGLDDMSLPDAGAGTFDAPETGASDPVSLEDTPAPADDFNFDTPPAQQDDAFNFDSGAPSLDDLSPEVALGTDSGATSSLSSDLSSLAAEDAATLDPQTLRRVRDTVRSYPTALRRRLSHALLDEGMKPSDSNELLQLLSEGASANEVGVWLDTKKVEEISEEAHDAEGPRIIMARPEYTEEGLARQERIIKLTRFGAIAAFAIFVLLGGTYFGLLKPFFYRQAVAKGRDTILQKGSAGIGEAELQFEKAISYYNDDTYAYLQYADAYRYKGLYPEAFGKLFADVKLEGPVAKVENKEVRSSAELFGTLKRVPIVAYASGDKRITVNGTPLTLIKKGAYVLSRLDNKKDEAQVLLALGGFHANPSARFAKTFYKNNYLGADYYRRVLMAQPKAPAFKKEEMLDRAVMGIGDIYYNEKDYDHALDYYKKIIDKEPNNVTAHAGILKSLLKLFKLNDDPRLVIQHHTLIRGRKLEAKLPQYIKARLAAFYIDLPSNDELRVKYNISPQNMLTGQELKTRADELLTSIFNSSETDIFGIKHEGSRFAEGYYQRARSYAKDKNQIRMALKQFEYAFHYDPRHFMALNDRAELLMAMNDYAGAIELLRRAKELSTPDKLAELGESEADETLSEAPVGIIPFNLGKAMYLDTIRDLANADSWLRMKETQKYQSVSDTGTNALLAQLDRIEQEFDEARRLGIAGTKAESDLLYYSGWSKFVRNNYREALADWEKIAPEKAASLPNLSLAQSHCYYRLAIEEANEVRREKYLNTALGLLFYAQDRYGALASRVPRVDAGNEKHARLFSNLAIVENNIGAVYEMLDDEKQSLIHYWRSIENTKRLGKENEIANLNIRLSFKRKALGEGENHPVIMDFVPPQVTED
ncbi:MAG: hypothetical protein LDLANPLL_01872 [Turneriella sp.]|nr:hypothetical protein [Turneriella sp.]